MPDKRWSGLSRVYYAGYDVTGQTNGTGVNMTLDSPEVSCFGDRVKSYVTGLNDSVANQKGFITAPANEAHRVLQAGIDAWQKVIDQCEGQFLRPLLNAHDGESPACQDIQAQIAAFRTLYR